MHDYQVGSIQFTIDLSQPLYEQVLQQMRNAIIKGEIHMGAKIPSVRELAQSLKINPNTVMRAYQELERDGLIEKRRGRGTFATMDAEQIQAFRKQFIASLVQDFLDHMDAIGVPRSEVMEWIKNMEREVKES